MKDGTLDRSMSMPISKFFRRSGPVLLFLLPLTLAVGGGCREREWKSRLVYARSPVAVYIEHREKEGKTVPQGYAHPAKISPEELKNLLGAIRYRAWGLFKGSRDETMAEGESLDRLVNPLSTWLAKVSPDERIRFLVTRNAWPMGIKGTSGVLFLSTPESLNLAFDLLDEGLSDDSGDPRTMVFRDDPVEIVGKEPEIIPPPEGTIVGAPEGRVHPRWMVIDPRKIPAPVVAAPPAAPPPQPPASPPGATAGAEAAEAEAIRQKLRNLEALRKEGTITEEEYGKARAEILLQK
jgi:hypothetical protein